MARDLPQIEIRVDLGVTVEALKCVAGAMAAKDQLELDIELGALAALREIQAMRRRAMLELGIAEHGYSAIRFEFDPSSFTAVSEALRAEFARDVPIARRT